MAASDKSVAISSTTDFSSDSTISDDWQELTKSDYAKVIFSDLLCNAASGTVECKFQITDNVHEDPNDYVGLFRIGYEDLSQCLVSKMLSQTKCEDDGKLQRCVFASNELPCLDDGFYQFLYVTRDQEVCGASMPFPIKMSPVHLKESSVSSSSSENMDGGFLLVKNEIEGKESSEHKKASAQQSTLSEQKKEEIAAWISQNPDYYSLLEQTRENTFTIDALQQSKDLAMKEVAQLYEILNTQNGELSQLKNMLAAYEEKEKMSQSLQDEKNASITEMRKSLTAYEEKIKLYELLQNEKDDQLRRVKNEFLLQEEKLRTSLSLQDQQQTEINDLKKELKEMKELQKVKGPQDLVHFISTSIKNFDFTDKDDLDKFFQLKIQLLIILSKMTRAIELLNICDEHGMHKEIHSIIEKDVKVNNCVGPTSGAVEDNDSLLAVSTNTSTLDVKIPDVPTSTAETSLLSNSREQEAANEDSSKKVSGRISFESEVLERQMIELPRFDVINETKANVLMADGSVDTENITVINRLTERIVKRGFKLFEDLEVVDDSSSDSASDASAFLECSSSLSQDLACVGRIIKALSCLANESFLEEFFVIVEDDDRNLIRKKDWNELLRRCALRYQIAILLEHNERQKEGIRRVSEKICDLFVKCMVLKDELSDSNVAREKLKSDIDKKNMIISKLKGELELKNSLLSHFSKQKENLEYKVQLAEKADEDYRARIVEASNIYKQQYTEIEKLSKKLRKYKSVKDKTKTSKGESSQFSSESSNTTSSFEMVQKDSVHNINDSDTGELMFEKASLISNEGIQTQLDSNKELKTLPENFPGPCLNSFDGLLPSILESENLITAGKTNSETVECKSNQTASLFSDFASYEHFQEIIKGIFENIKNPSASRGSQECSISCYVCKEVFSLGPGAPVDLMDHLQSEHLMKICPVCGQLFEDAIPPKYYHIHVEQHFETE